jgi:hypothetical protein
LPLPLDHLLAVAGFIADKSYLPVGTASARLGHCLEGIQQDLIRAWEAACVEAAARAAHTDETDALTRLGVACNELLRHDWETDREIVQAHGCYVVEEDTDPPPSGGNLVDWANLRRARQIPYRKRAELVDRVRAAIEAVHPAEGSSPAPEGEATTGPQPDGAADLNGPPALKADDLKILRLLRKARPRLLKLYDLEAGSSLSRRTLSGCLQYLRDHGLAEQPRGPKSGWTITDEGVALLRPRRR